MEPEDLTLRLRLAAIADRQRTAACPDDREVAAYVDGTLEQADRIELHLADCEACSSLVGELSNYRHAGATEPAPEPALMRARQLARSPRRGWMRFTPHLMAAAIAAVSISVVIHFLALPESTPDRQPPPDMRTTRNAASIATQLQVLSPTPGEAIAAADLLFHWSEVPGSRFYEVHIVTDTGERVSEHRVAGNEWRPDPHLKLRPGTEYFVRIDAYDSGSRTVRSAHIPFRIADPP